MHQIQLHDGRPGLRALLHVETRDPGAAASPSPGGEGQGEGGTAVSQSGAPRLSTLVPRLPFWISCPTSTATIDRYHEIIDPAGWRLDSYRRNPVFQNAHNYGDILFTLGTAMITEVRSLSTNNSQPSTALFQRIQFATDVNPIARIAYGLDRGQFLNAVSVGFIPLRWEDATSDPARSLLTAQRPVHCDAQKANLSR